MAKYEKDQPVSIINENNDVESDYSVFNPKPDKEGMISVVKDGHVIRVNPKRIVTKGANKVSTPITEVATDPSLSPATDLPDAAPKARQTPKITKAKVVAEKANLSEIATKGELWIKGNIEFDQKTNIQACYLLFPEQNRSLCFNLYNGSFGRKATKPPIDEILAGENKGYLIQDIGQLRERLVHDGYKKKV